MHALTLAPEITPADRLGMTVFVAVVAHLVLILGVTFIPEDKNRNSVKTLDIILVQQKTESEPEDAEFLAQANQDGGGDSDQKSRPTTPLPSPFIGPTPDITSTSVPVPPPQPATQALTPTREPTKDATPEPTVSAATKPIIAQSITASEVKVIAQPEVKPTKQAKPEPPAPSKPVEKINKKKFAASEPDRVVDSKVEPAPKSKPAPATRQIPTVTLDAAALINRSLAMASLSAEISEKLQAYAERPRRKFISARTREHKYAVYMDAWRAKVERIGNLNYPDDARRKKLSGSLLLEVSLKPDGTISEINLRRSSGHKVLDDAAIRIVKLSAPFAEFPKEIAREVDILHVERTWLFLSNNQFASR